MSRDVSSQPRSVSQVEQYEKCGHKFYLQRVERVPQRPAAWLFQGTAFHSAAEHMEKAGRRPDEEELVQLFSDQYSTLVNKALDEWPDLDMWLTAGGKPAATDIEDRYVLGQQQVRGYARWSTDHKPVITYVKGPDGQPKLGLELYFKVTLGGVEVRGYIDQLEAEEDGSVRVRDHKTGSSKSRFQLETYKVAVEKAYGEVVKRGDWFLAKEGRLSKPVDLSGVTEEQVAEKYVAMDEGVKAGRFPARPGYHCRMCDVSHACSFFST